MGLIDTGRLKAAKTTSLRRRIHCDVICHTTARRRSWQLSPDSDIGPSDPTLSGHSWGQYLVGTIPRSIRICVPNLVMIGPAVWPPILDRQTHRQNLYYIDIYIFYIMYYIHIVKRFRAHCGFYAIENKLLLLLLGKKLGLLNSLRQSQRQWTKHLQSVMLYSQQGRSERVESYWMHLVVVK